MKVYSTDEIDLAYITGAFNAAGIDGLQKELKRIKKVGKQPHDIIDFLKSESKPKNNNIGVWVKACERKPEPNINLSLKVNGVPHVGYMLDYGVNMFYINHDVYPTVHPNNVEWLDESNLRVNDTQNKLASVNDTQLQQKEVDDSKIKCKSHLKK